MPVLSSARTYTALAVVQAGDAVLCVKPVRFVGECLDDVEFPPRYRWIFPVIKFASALGLVSVWRFPPLARFTALMLTIYFTLAVGAHVRVRDFGRNFAAASTLFVVFATLAVKGPRLSR
jgi:hypothetical protein